jgi:hypothetical protein
MQFNDGQFQWISRILVCFSYFLSFSSSLTLYTTHTQRLMQFNDGQVFLRIPNIFFDVWVQMVMPALATLFARPSDQK